MECNPVTKQTQFSKGRSAGQLLTLRKLPKAWHEARLRRPLPCKNLVVTFDPEQYPPFLDGFARNNFYGKVGLSARFAALAQRRHGADKTLRVFGQADCGAQFHHGLIEGAWTFPVQQTVCHSCKMPLAPDRGDIGWVGRHPAKNSKDIAI